jgi:hypothetical protein
MLSIEHRFLFVHIPKTGGNSVQNVLRRYSDDEVVCLAPHHDGVERFEVRSPRYKTQKHSTLADYRREYGKELFDSLFKFACVRNPWDRVASFYFSPHRQRVSWNKEDFSRFIATIEPVAHFLSLDGQSPPRLASSLRNIDHVLRFESLQADFESACKAIGLPAQALPFRNQSSKASYRTYFDDETAELVRVRFQEEITHFGYAF